MATIDTAAGPIDTDRLGTVLTHEHIFVLNEDYRLNFLPDWDEDAEVDAAVQTLTRLKEAGVDTLMDVSVAGLGRNIGRIQRVAARTDLNVVVATGLFTYHDLPFQFHYTGPGLGFDVPDPLDRQFVRDLTVGIGDTDVKAGFLFCAIEAEGLSTGVERVMRAVGRAAIETGAPVVVHTNPHTQSGLIAQRVLAEEGVDLARVQIAHCGDTTDLDYLMRLADAGSTLGLDRFGLEVLLPYPDRMRTLLALLERGYGDRIALSQDSFCFSDWFDPRVRREVAPDWDYFQVTGRVIPDLRAAGISDDAIDRMVRDSPRRFLTRAASTAGSGSPLLAVANPEKSGTSTENL
ncbi:phosphotriesterase family protein [Gordonia neofelifaecis]|uniref:N-acylhomoserine lactonase n=1 Tax=Gordonia neofelifaecis NRRL B-59395 TaxID=644548 RepID=F1YGS8_9ACTN|nr:phosphotriesterase [Gordonia neofelifaecis]EGD56226.1 N-acylhomoserine lactonase [Gordonia neofelifaecis NRRL B-59395]